MSRHGQWGSSCLILCYFYVIILVKFGELVLELSKFNHTSVLKCAMPFKIFWKCSDCKDTHREKMSGIFSINTRNCSKNR